MTQTALFELMNGLFDMVKVFAPFCAEEFYQDFYGKDSSVFEKQYFTTEKLVYLSQVSPEVDWSYALEARKLVQASLEPLQKAKTVKSRTEVNVVLDCPEAAFMNLQFVQKYYRLGDVFAVSNAQVSLNDSWNVHVVDLKQNENYQKCPRCWNYELLSTFKNCLCSECFDNN
jgi:isoleucyl-tRNA synthetase